jgi:transposase
MVAEIAADYESEAEAIRHVAAKLGVSREAIRRWRRQTEIDSGARAGMTSDEHAEIKRLKREISELRRANESLRTASAFFAAELDRPTTR